MNTMIRFLLRTIIALFGFILVPHEVCAQIYEADFIIGNYIRAERTDADGTRWTVKIPNGTKLSVDGRVVRGDSTDCRSVLAEFVYDGKQYTTQARWLRFSDENADGVTDLFAGDDFSPSDRFVTKRLPFTRFDPQSEKGHFLYGLTLPVAQFILMLLAVLLLLKSRFLWLSVILFAGAVGLQIYSALMLGNDALWWCLPEYQGTGGAIVGFIPLALYLAFELMYIFSTWAFSKTEARLWPVIVAFVIIYPAIVVGYMLSGSLWIGLAVAFSFPLIVNGVKGGLSGIYDTVVLLVGAVGFLATLSAAFFAGWQIVASVVTVCPLLAFLIASLTKNVGHGMLVRRGPDGYYYDENGHSYTSREAGEKAVMERRRQDSSR